MNAVSRHHKQLQIACVLTREPKAKLKEWRRRAVASSVRFSHMVALKRVEIRCTWPADAPDGSWPRLREPPRRSNRTREQIEKRRPALLTRPPADYKRGNTVEAHVTATKRHLPSMDQQHNHWLPCSSERLQEW